MVESVYQDIILRLKLQGFENVKKFEKASKSLQDMAGSGLLSTTEFKRLNKQLMNQFSVTSKASKKRKEYTGKLKAERKEQQKLNKEMKDASKAISAFSVTLPLLFGFQSVSTGISSLIDPAMNLLGVTDLYNQFLALKYLPTAEEQLENVLATGEAWLDESESQRKAEGDMLLFTKQIADSIAYMAEWANIGGAIGRIVPVLGESIGTGLGVAFAGLNVAMVAADVSGSRIVSQFSGMQSASMLLAGEGLAKLKGAIDTAFGLNSQQNVIDTKEEVDELVRVWDQLSETERKTLMVQLEISNPELFDYLKEQVQAKGGEVPTVSPAERTQILTKGGEPTLPASVVKAQQLQAKAQIGMVGALPAIASVVPEAKSTIGNVLKAGLGLLGFQYGGIVPGTPSTPVPIMAHGGETVIPANKSSGNNISINPVYNINVSDPRELERMFRENNYNLVEEVKRLISV